MAGIPERPDAFFRLSPVEGSKVRCFAVRRGEIERRAIGAAFYAPELRLFIERLAKNPNATGFLRDYVDINPKIDASDLEPDSLVSFVPMDAVEDGATGGVNLTLKRLAEVQKGYTPFAEGDILWAKITPCMENGKSCMVSGLINGIGFGSTEFHVLRSHDERLSQSFLWEFLNQETLRKVARYAFTGSAGHQRVPDSFLVDLPFPLLSSGDQKRLISRMGAARAERRAKRAEADELLLGLDGYLLATLGLTAPPKDERKVFGITRSLATRRFDPRFFHPKHIEIERQLQQACSRDDLSIIGLGELCRKIVQPVEFIREYEDTHENAVRFLRASSVRDGHLDLSDHLFVATEKLERSPQSFIDEGDLLITRTGAKAGSVCAVPALAHKFAVSSHTLRLVIDKTKAVPEFVEVFLISTFGKNQINRLFTGAAQPQLQIESIKSILIPLPIVQVQHIVANEARRRREEANRLRAKAEADWQAAKRWFEEQLLGPVQL